jgi:hypothetical protein
VKVDCRPLLCVQEICGGKYIVGLFITYASISLFFNKEISTKISKFIALDLSLEVSYSDGKIISCRYETERFISLFTLHYSTVAYVAFVLN